MDREEKYQQTIAKPVDYSGLTLHSGQKVDIKCLPAEADTGIIFRRIDLSSKPEIPVKPEMVVSTTRCTSIGIEKQGKKIRVNTIEHLLAALWGLAIDNVVIEINSPEMPVADGSAYPFVNLLKSADIRKLSSKRRVYTISSPVSISRGKMTMVVIPYDGFKISYTLDYNHQVIGTQFLEFDKDKNSFIEEISRARTFGFKREVEALHKKGLALGGSLDNAVLIGEKETINSLRYPDEFVRHKILDVIGDMALNGFIKGHIITVRSGHSLHVELAREINQKISSRRVKK